jgi:hypothetical protein
MELPIWSALKIPLIVLGVIALLATAIALSRYQEQREMKAALDYAETQGWDFSRDDTEGLTAKVAEILSDYQFHPYHIRSVEPGWRSVYLFDCSYKSRAASARKNYSHRTACLIRSKRVRSVEVPVEISTRDWTEVMLSDKIEMGESPFAQKLVVQSRDPASAKTIVNESVQGVLLEYLHNPRSLPASVILGPGGLVVLTARTVEPERLQELLELARALESVARWPEADESG